MYLYHAVDSEGNTIDFYLSKNEKEAINKKKKSVIISAKNDNTRLLTDEQKITYVIFRNGIISIEITEQDAHFLVNQLAH